MIVVVIVALWAAAGYRIALSIRLPATLWRSSFTVCIVCVASAATLTRYGYVMIERPLGAWNATNLLVHLLLAIAAGAAMIYIITLRHSTVPLSPVVAWLVLTSLIVCFEIVSWIVAPIHSEPYEQLTAPFGDLLSVAVFNGSFELLLMLTTAATAWLSWSKLASPGDPTRTVSLALTGSACLFGTVMFGLMIAVTVMRFVGLDPSAPEGAALTMMPYVLIVLAMGTLTLWLAPPIIAFLQSYMRWRTLRPLWLQLVALQPSVRLDAPVQGTPSRRVQTRLQRAVIEIHDALRLTPLRIPSSGGVEDLGRALHCPNPGPHMAADLLSRTTTREADLAQLLELARTYTRGSK